MDEQEMAAFVDFLIEGGYVEYEDGKPADGKVREALIKALAEMDTEEQSILLDTHRERVSASIHVG